MAPEKRRGTQSGKRRKKKSAFRVLIKNASGKMFVRGPMNYNLFFAILFLNIFGVIMIYSSSYYSASNMGLPTYYFLKSQIQYVFLGLVAMWVVSKLNYHMWMVMGWLGLALSVILVLLLKTPLGHSELGAVRWLDFKIVKFQAAEPVKLFMMVFFARFVSVYGVRRWKPKLFAIGVALGMTVLLGFISDNMSTAIIILGICFVILVVSDEKVWGYFLAVAIVAAIVTIFLLAVEFLIPPKIDENFRISRIRAFFHPQDYMDTYSVQPMQSLYAIGAGGFWGKGLGQSLVKYRLSEPYNDYILAIVCEELGVFGTCLLLFLYGYLLLQTVKVGRNAYDLEGKVFCTGVFVQVSIQMILNTMVVFNLFPTTGVTLPFVSYGGASAVFLLTEYGVVFSIDNYAKNKKFRRQAEREVNDRERRRRGEET